MTVGNRHRAGRCRGVDNGRCVQRCVDHHLDRLDVDHVEIAERGEVERLPRVLGVGGEGGESVDLGLHGGR